MSLFVLFSARALFPFGFGGLNCSPHFSSRLLLPASVARYRWFTSPWTSSSEEEGAAKRRRMACRRVDKLPAVLRDRWRFVAVLQDEMVVACYGVDGVDLTLQAEEGLDRRRKADKRVAPRVGEGTS